MRDVIDNDFTSSRLWRAKRERILKRDNYECQLSKRYGKHLQAEVVHHIFPRADYPQYALCDWNLVSLTLKQHNTLHTDGGGLTDKGKQLLLKTARQNNIKIRED